MRKTVISGLLAVGLGAVVTIAAVDNNGGSGRQIALAGSQQQVSAPRLVVVGLTDQNRLVAFLAANSRNMLNIGRITGLAGDTSLIGIDYRVQDGKLYGVGDAGGIYTVSTRTARATKVSQLSVALRGTAFGVDFNPAANRLRVISDAGQNLRHNIDDPNGAPAAGVTAEDGMLTYPPATTAAAGVTAAAYTNNDLDPNTATTLFDLDSTLDQVAIQFGEVQCVVGQGGGRCCQCSGLRCGIVAACLDGIVGACCFGLDRVYHPCLHCRFFRRDVGRYFDAIHRCFHGFGLDFDSRHLDLVHLFDFHRRFGW